jgi:hypothetical protein
LRVELRNHLEKFGSVGAVVAAAACPICFPKLAVVGALFGLGAFSAYEAQLFIAAQALVLVTAAGHVLAYRQHRNARLLTSALLSAVLVFAGLYWVPTEWLVYVGFGGLVAASSVDLWTRIPRWARRPKLSSLLTCPNCGARRRESMPRDACQYLYECPACRAVLRPLPGDCCVFCSYGTVKCPPMQLTKPV